MSLIDQAATFRGKIADHGVSLTKNEFPQLVLQLIADEIYDDEEGVWVDWQGYDEREITAYLVLFGGKGRVDLTCKQLEKITGWEGNSFQALNDADLSEVGIQFRVEERTYQEKTSLQVTWVDEYDAEPGRKVRKLDAGDLKKLDAQYSQLLKQFGKRAAPATAPAAVPTTEAQAAKKPAKPKTPGVITKRVKKKTNDPLGLSSIADAPGGPEPPQTAIKPATRVAPPVVNNPDLPTGHCTKDEAWDAVTGLKAKDVSDEGIAEIWTKAVLSVAPKGQDAGITDEQWYKIKEIVLAETAII